jgi:hypothetical protein
MQEFKRSLIGESTTGYEDKNGVPLMVGDLIKVRHFVARNRRKVYMYKRVLIVKNKVCAVANQELGLKPTAYCHKCNISDCGEFEIVDGPSFDDPRDGVLICWWERKQKMYKSLFWRNVDANT